MLCLCFLSVSVPASPCQPNPCKNGGSCVKGNRRFQCTCRNGYTGKSCEVGKGLMICKISFSFRFRFLSSNACSLPDTACAAAPSDCYVGNGESYRGMVSMTENRTECLDWHSNAILAYREDPYVVYSDFDGLQKNYCRCKSALCHACNVRSVIHLCHCRKRWNGKLTPVKDKVQLCFSTFTSYQLLLG